jgi:heat-inducible transcriptional repressor
VESLPRRQQEVLQATVQHYVDTVEPVGSTTLVRRFGLPASPATVRSAMGALELRGLLTQPHTSAGRIPSQLGYRHYVDRLLPAPGPAVLRLDRELAGLSLQWAALDDLLLHLARRLAGFTGVLSLITRPRRPGPGLQEIRLVASADRMLVFLVQSPALTTSLNLRLPHGGLSSLPVLERWANNQLRQGRGGTIAWERMPEELRLSGTLLRQALENHACAAPERSDGVVAAGLGGLLGQPEFGRTSTLLPLVQLVEHHPEQVLGPGEAIWIGNEHPEPALGQCSVVQATYRTADGGEGQVALVGPMRMAYATARSAVQSVAGLLQRLLS